MKVVNKKTLTKEELATKMRSRFNLDSLSAEERDALDIALTDIYYEKKNAQKAESLKKLKEKYERKYFNINDEKIIYIDEIKDEYLYSGWYITNREESLFKSPTQTKWIICQGLFRDSLFNDRFNKAGNKIEDAKIKNAIELSQFEVNDWLEKWFEQLQQELIFLKKE